MKRIELIFILLIVLCTGCSKDKQDASNNLFSYNDNPILDKYETKILDTDVTYKEIALKNEQKGFYHVYIIVYNNREEPIDVIGLVTEYNSEKETSQATEVDSAVILAKSVFVLSFSLIGADNYKTKLTIEKRNTKINYISKDDYTFDSYIIKEENHTMFVGEEVKQIPIPTLNLYLKYHANKNNVTHVQILGFKNGELVCEGSSYGSYVDNDYNKDYNKDVSKNGDIGLFDTYCINAYNNGITVNDMDQFIYFVSGFYED